MTEHACEPADRLLALFDRIRQLTFGQQPEALNDVSIHQLTLMAHIAAMPACGIRDLASAMELTPPTVSVAVRRLRDAGLVERRPDPRDGRSIQLLLTDEGQRRHEHMQCFRRQKMALLAGGLSAGEHQTLLALLDKAVAAAEGEQHRAVAEKL